MKEVQTQLKAPEYGALQIGISALILTYNEAPNIGRTLERLAWADEIVVIDSFSTDETLEIIGKFPRTRVLQRKFDTFAGQCNFGLENVRTDWVLSLDADYVLSDELIAEICPRTENGERRAEGGERRAESWDRRAEGGRRRAKSGDFSVSAFQHFSISNVSDASPTSDLCPVASSPIIAYTARFRYCINGCPLRASLYPPRTVLYRKSHAHYNNDGHGHRVQIEGAVGTLSGWIDHDDRKPLDRWLQEQSRYARIEAEHLLNTPSSELNFADRVRRKVVVAPFLVFFYTLFGKGLMLDGWPGLYYVAQRTLAELLLSLRLVEQRIAKR